MDYLPCTYKVHGEDFFRGFKLIFVNRFSKLLWRFLDFWNASVVEQADVQRGGFQRMV